MMIKNFFTLSIKLIKDIISEHWLWFLNIIILGLIIYESNI